MQAHIIQENYLTHTK